ncbi:uncharacterized protein LOC8027219 [Ixodes scapularis]|nr:uncharacterized protein LOC8027219 [Ixodes scapularis]XP_040357360.1 uncharacterized protein LOC8027219 [Ixodes scapularis]
MDVYEREFGDLLHYKPKITVYEQFVLQNLHRMLRLYNFLPRNIIMLRFEELWQRHLLRHPEIRKTHEEERKNPRKSRRPNRQRAPRTLGKNALRTRVSDDVDLYTSPAPKSKASRKRWSTKQEKRSSPKASRARCYPPLKIKTLKRTLPVPKENHATPSTMLAPRERSRHFLPCTRSPAHAADNELGGAVLVQTNSNAKSCEDDDECLSDSAAMEQNTVLQKPIENEEKSLPLPRNDPNIGIRNSSIPNTRCPPRTPLANAAAEREDAATAEEAIEMGRMGTPSNRNKHEREIKTVLFSEPMSLCSSVSHEEIYVRDSAPAEMSAATEDVFEELVNQLTSPIAAREKGKTSMLLSEPMSLCDSIVLGENSARSFMSIKDACDRPVDPSASKERKSFQRKLSLTRKSEPLQSSVTNEDAMHARPISKKMQLRADEELKICPVHEIQRGEKQILYEPPQRFGDAASETATQNRQIAETRAEKQPVGSEKEQHLLGTIQQSRFVHNKLEIRPAAAKRSDGKHQISPPNGMSGLADIVRSARPRKFEHCKVSQGSEPSETDDTADAATSRDQCNASRVVGKLSAVKQTVRQKVHSSRKTEGRETTVILPGPESREATEGQSEKLDSACIKESSTLNFCHAEAESEGSCWPERTWKSAHAEDCKTPRAEVTDGPSLSKGRDGAASPEFAHNPYAKSIAMDQAGHKKTKMPKRKELPSKYFQADPIPGTEHPAPPLQWKMKWKDTTERKKTKCTPGAGVADVHDDRESPWDDSGQDDKLFPFITKRRRIDKRKGGKKATDKERQDKKTPNEERPGRRQLLEDKIADVDLVGGVCNEKEMVRPIARDVGKKKHDKNHVDNVPDEGRHCKKKPDEERLGRRQLLEDKIADVDLGGGVCNEKGTVRPIAKDIGKKKHDKNHVDNVPDEGRHCKKKPDEEQPGRRQLLEDKIADVDLIGGVCNEKEAVRPIAKDVGKKKHDKNHVDNVPDEGRHCKKKSAEERPGRRQLLEDKIADVDLGGGVCNEKGTVRPIAKDVGKKNHDKNHVDNVPYEGRHCKKMPDEERPGRRQLLEDKIADVDLGGGVCNEKGTVRPIAKDVGKKNHAKNHVDNVPNEGRHCKKMPDEERPGRRQLLKDKIADIDLGGGVCNEKGMVRPIAKDVGKKKHDKNHVDNVPDEGRQCKKKPDEERPGRRQLLEDKIADVDLVGRVCNEKGTVRPIAKDVGKKKYNKNHVDNVPDEGRHCKKKPDEEQPGRRQLLEDKIADVDLGGGVCNEKGTVRPIAKDVGKKNHAKNHVDNVPNEGRHCKKMPDEERPGRRQLLKDKIADIDLGGGVCNEKGMVRPIAKDVGKKKHDKNHVDNVPNEGRQCKKKPDEERPGRRQLLEDKIADVDLVGRVCNEKGTVRPIAKDVGKKKYNKNHVDNVPDEGRHCKKKPDEARSDEKGVDKTGCFERQMTEKSQWISAKQNRADKQTEKHSKKTASLQSVSIAKKLVSETPGKSKYGKKQQGEGRSSDEEPDKTQQAERKPSRGVLQQIKYHREENGRKRPFQAVSEESSVHERSHHEKHQGDGKSDRMHKKKVPLEKEASKADQGKENRKQVVTEVPNEKKQDECRSGKEGHNKKEQKITKPIKKARDRNRKEADSFLLSFEEEVNRDSTYFPDELELEELSNEIDDDDFLSDEGPNENILGKENHIFGGGDEKTATGDARFVPFSLESDEDGDRPKEDADEASNFFSCSLQKKQKLSLSFSQRSSDSEELFTWPVGDQPKAKPKKSVQFTDPGFQVPSPTNDDAESFDTCESGSRATTPPCTPWKDIATRSVTFPDPTSPDRTDMYGNEIVEELRRNFEKHRAILAAKCVPDVNEPSQGWSGSDDYPILLSRDRPEFFGSSPEDSPKFDV